MNPLLCLYNTLITH